MNVLKSISSILTQEQENKVKSMISLGYEFHSFFHDGSVELIDPAKTGVIYIERNGEITQS